MLLQNNLHGCLKTEFYGMGVLYILKKNCQDYIRSPIMELYLMVHHPYITNNPIHSLCFYNFTSAHAAPPIILPASESASQSDIIRQYHIDLQPFKWKVFHFVGVYVRYVRRISKRKHFPMVFAIALYWLQKDVELCGNQIYEN